MVGEDIHTLTGAYAVGAVEDDVERRQFERHLELCDACREEVRSLRATIAVLGEAVAVPPPAHVRDAVLSAVRTTPQQRSAPRTTQAAPGARRGPLLVAAAVLAVATLISGGLAWNQYQSAQRAHELVSVLADPTAQHVSKLASGGGEVTLTVVGARAAVATSAMPALPDGRTYQLWIVRPSGIRSAGLGPAAASGGGKWARLVQGVRTGDVVAVSVEPSGGSDQPTTTPIVTLKV